MPEIMTQEELDATLKASEKKGGKGRPGMQTYDFKHPARVNRQQLMTLENLHDNFARLTSANFCGKMRTVVDCDTAFVDQTTYAEFIASLSNPSASYQFMVGPHGGQAVVDIAMPVAFGYIDRCFGGKGASTGVDARQLTQIEMGELVPLVKRIMTDLEATWSPIAPIEIHDIELETNPEFMQVSAPHEIVILIAFEMNSTNMTGLVSVCYPFFTLEPLLRGCGQVGGARRPGEATAAERVANQQRLAAATLDVQVELGKARLSAAQAAQLRVGDVLVSGTRATDPVPVYVQGQPRLEGWPFAEDGRHRIKVTGPISPGTEARIRE